MREFGKVRGSWPSVPALDSVSMGTSGTCWACWNNSFLTYRTRKETDSSSRLHEVCTCVEAVHSELYLENAYTPITLQERILHTHREGEVPISPPPGPG